MPYFSALNYSIGEEDSTVEHAVLKTRPGASILAVAGSGSRVLPLLACRPEKLVCVDVSPWQLALTSLRLSALATLEYADYLAFFGYKPGMMPARREQLFRALTPHPVYWLQAETLLAQTGWTAPLYIGRFERMIRQLRQVNALITGPAGTGIFECRSLAEQQAYLDSSFPHRRWSLVVRLLGNATVLNGLLYRGEFPRNNTGVSAAKHYAMLFDRLFSKRLARESFFLQMLFLGRIQYEDGFLAEVDPDLYAAGQSALRHCELSLRLRNVFAALDEQEQADFISLSDVPSFLPDDAASQVLQTLRPRLADGGTVVFRSHLRYIEPCSDGYARLDARFKQETDRETSGLWRISIFGKEAVNV